MAEDLDVFSRGHAARARKAEREKKKLQARQQQQQQQEAAATGGTANPQLQGTGAPPSSPPPPSPPSNTSSHTHLPVLQDAHEATVAAAGVSAAPPQASSLHTDLDMLPDQSMPTPYALQQPSPLSSSRASSPAQLGPGGKLLCI